MAKRLTQYSRKNERLKRGTRIVKGKGWRLIKRRSGAKHPTDTVFVGTLIETMKVGGETLAIFKVHRLKKSEVK